MKMNHNLSFFLPLCGLRKIALFSIFIVGKSFVVVFFHNLNSTQKNRSRENFIFSIFSYDVADDDDERRRNKHQ